MDFVFTLVSSILSGIAIAIGGAAYLAFYSESVVIASMLFSIGFLAVVVFELNLFTDRIGFLFTQGNIDRNINKMAIGFIGNVLGAFIMGIILMPEFKDSALPLFQAMAKENTFSCFLGSIICGMLIFIGIHGYRRANSGFTGCAILLFSATTIAVCNFDYAITNLFFISASFDSVTMYSKRIVDVLAAVLMPAIGNALGAMIFALLYRFKNLENEENRKHKHHSHRHHHKSERKSSEESNA